MKEYNLKYGCNPNQKPARVFVEKGELPFEVLNGQMGYINFLDALSGWQLVSELKKLTSLPCAASFKHVSPSGVALGKPLSVALKKSCFVADIPNLDLSLIACAYARARGTDRMSSFGDFIALSDTCDETTAKIISREVSDGIIAPDFTEKALEILKAKKDGKYPIVKIDQNYIPEETERKQVFGITFEQKRNDFTVNAETFSNIVTKNKNLSDDAIRDMTVALITLKYTQSNSVCYCYDGQTIGIGAGQQSRIHCTRLAGNKADLWNLRQSPKVLSLPFKKGISRPEKNNVIDLYLSDDSAEILSGENWKNYFTVCPNPFTNKEKREYLDKISGITLGSDAFFPFSDNVVRAKKSGVSYIIQPSGSKNDGAVIQTCDNLNMVAVFTQMRLFHH